MPVNQSGTVKTNPKRGSVAACSMVGIVPITFKELWDNYYGDKTPPYTVNGKIPDEFENQCAIRMSVTFHRTGIKMTSFSEKLIKPEKNEATIGRLLLKGLPTSTRANEFSQWLQTRPVCGIGPAEDITGKDWQKKIKGRTGIVYFGDFWQRDGLEELRDIASGGHIDLWNNFRLTSNWTTVPRFFFGINRMNMPGGYIYTDYANAKRILFFEVK